MSNACCLGSPDPASTTPLSSSYFFPPSLSPFISASLQVDQLPWGLCIFLKPFTLPVPSACGSHPLFP